jgi:uncharacterized membrane protein YjfL (UPF0719 family)
MGGSFRVFVFRQGSSRTYTDLLLKALSMKIRADLWLPFMDRPTGVTAIAILFFVAAAYLCAAGGIMLASPGTLSMAAGAPLLGGLELAGPYMFLLIGVVGALTGWGLLRMNNWARRAAMVVAFAGFVMLIPTVSAAVISLSWSLAWGGVGIIVRVVVVWYLWMDPVAKQFSNERVN